MINLIISGRVGQDAKEVGNGCLFHLATTKKGYTKKDGTAIADKTIWFSVFATKGLTPYVKKGDSVTIYTDFITTDIYEEKVNLSCYAISLEFGGKGSGQSSQPTQQQAAPQQQASPQQQAPVQDYSGGQNEELPF